ncbi:MAG TPA: chemotaxis protein CheD [Clostridia bacterium]|nr:chemotaxis protein CheD [Clostridia bacterium]
MSNLIVVGISDLKITRSPEILITYALGSCIGTCLYDSQLHIAGLSHILLPESAISKSDHNVMKFADTAIEELVKAMEKIGSSRRRLTAKIAGGANMFASVGSSIGERNVAAVKQELTRLNIRITGEDTGKNYGRTVEFHSENGDVIVKSFQHGNKIL